MAAKTLQTGPQPNGSHSVAWQTYVGHRLLLKVAASCCCHLPGRLVRRMVCNTAREEQWNPITMPIDKMLTGVLDRRLSHSHILIPITASGREDFRNSPNLVRCTYNGNCAETASYSTLDSQDMDRQATLGGNRRVVFLASEANFHASQFFEARLTGRKCCCSLASWLSTTASFKSTVDAVA